MRGDADGDWITLNTDGEGGDAGVKECSWGVNSIENKVGGVAGGVTMECCDIEEV